MYEQLFELEEAILKIIASQKRLEIIRLLNDKELRVSDMVEMLGVRQANLSQHLALLRQQGIVTARKSGLNVYYRLTDVRIAEAIGLVREFLRQRSQFNPQIDTVIKSGSRIYPVVKDVVCGMRLGHSEVGASAKYRGELYYFCATGCKSKFINSPARYRRALQSA